MSRVIACANCGARYKLPDTFHGANARCKGCGAVIEVESSVVEPAQQQEARAEAHEKAPEPKAEKPSRPAARTSRASASRSRPAGGRAGKRGHGAANDTADDEAPTHGSGRAPRGGRGAGRSGGRAGARSGGSGRARGGHAGRGGRRGMNEDDAPSNSKTGMILGIAGVAVAAIITVIVLNQGDGKDKGKGTAGTGQQQQQQPVVEQPKTDKPEAVAKKDDAGKKDDTGKKDDATAKTDTAKKDDKSAKAATAKKEQPKKEEPKITAFDAKTLDPAPWPDDIDAGTRTKAEELAKTAAEDLSRAGMKAAEPLGGMGRAGFVAIVNELRKLNYFDDDQSDAAFALNEVIEKKLVGRNMGYKVRVIGEPIKQEDAWWNAKIVQSWMKWFETHNTPDQWTAWQEYVKKLRAQEEKGQK